MRRDRSEFDTLRAWIWYVMWQATTSRKDVPSHASYMDDLIGLAMIITMIITAEPVAWFVVGVLFGIIGGWIKEKIDKHHGGHFEFGDYLGCIFAVMWRCGFVGLIIWRLRA